MMKYNIIVIVSDTFRHDLLFGKFKVRKGVSARAPNLDRLACEGVVFTRAYLASFPTVPHRHDLMSGRYTFTYAGWQPLPRGEPVVQEALGKAGYVTMMVADTPHILKDGYHYDRGFHGWVWIRGQENDRYRTDPEEVELPCSPEKLRSVETTVQHLRNNALRVFEEDWIPAKTATEAMRWLERNYRRPFYLYIDFFDPHEPWDPPKWYVEMYDPGYEGEEVIYPVYGPCDYLRREELEHCRALYAAEATLVDKWIGRLLEKVEELGLLENTAIIFTSDHGFYLGEHGLIGKSIIMGGYHGYTPLYEEVAHIPLIIRPPDAMGKEVDRVGELVQTPDITATILDLAGLKCEWCEGCSLLPLIRGEGVEWRDFAVSTPPLIHGAGGGLRPTITTERWSLILASEETPPLEEVTYTMMVDGVPRVLKPFGRVETELYDLEKDPRQEENVLEENMDVAKELHQKFVEMLRRLNAPEEVVKPWLRCKGL